MRFLVVCKTHDNSWIHLSFPVILRWPRSGPRRMIGPGRRPSRLPRLKRPGSRLRVTANIRWHARWPLAHDRERHLALAEPHDTVALAHHRLPRALAGNPALALAQHVIEGGRHGSEHAQR